MIVTPYPGACFGRPPLASIGRSINCHLANSRAQCGRTTAGQATRIFCAPTMSSALIVVRVFPAPGSSASHAKDRGAIKAAPDS